MNDLPLIIDDRETPKFWVNRKTMIAQDILDQERAEIFDKCWLYVGHESELPNVNDFRTRRVGGRSIIFTRGRDGEINVLVNTCPHRGMEVESRASGNGRLLRCFYHGWAFNTAGDLVSMPDEESYPDGWSKAERCLPRPAYIDSYRGFWFLCWDTAQKQSLYEYLGAATDFIDLIADQSETLMQVAPGTHLYSMKANWKLLVENSIDGYHAMTTHNRYIQMVTASGVDMKSRMGETGNSNDPAGGLDLGNGHAAVANVDMSGGDYAGTLSRQFPDAEAVALHRQRREGLIARYGERWTNRMLGGRNVLIFPNLMLIDLGMGCTIRTFYPDEPGYMEITAWELSPPEMDDHLLKLRLSDFLTFWGPAGLATPDDVEALERCQRGFRATGVDPWNDLSRGMGKRRPKGDEELQMRTFWRRYNELMTGEVSKPEVEVYRRVVRETAA